MINQWKGIDYDIIDPPPNENMVNNYTEAEIKVREATSNDPWGPSSSLMAEIADLTFNVVAFAEVMGMVWKRLNDHGKNWRHVYKAEEAQCVLVSLQHRFTTCLLEVILCHLPLKCLGH
uniref:ENTH domain-containing protein n=1 Tax=Maylandia zebra TaxID=106582 RepID=A0A3P9C6X0_9CICH